MTPRQSPQLQASSRLRSANASRRRCRSYLVRPRVLSASHYRNGHERARIRSPARPVYSALPLDSLAGRESSLSYEGARRILGAVKALRCTFNEASRFDFEGGRRIPGDESWSITIDAIDSVHGRARIITSNVAANAQLVALTPGGLQILEEATGGNVFLTTVYAVGMQAKSGETTFFAVRSSHLVLPPGASIGGKEVAGLFARRPLAVSLTGACVPIAAD